MTRHDGTGRPALRRAGQPILARGLAARERQYQWAASVAVPGTCERLGQSMIHLTCDEEGSGDAVQSFALAVGLAACCFGVEGLVQLLSGQA